MIMPNDYPLISIIIATYNSSHILPKALDALKEQSYPSDRIEIIAVDGGSSDNTRTIAEAYGCRVVYNYKKHPVSANIIGMNVAKGKYLVTLDHDEILTNKESLLIRIQALIDNPSCKIAMCSGYKRPSDYPGLNQYISEFGDPFSLFYYRCSKDYKHFLDHVKKYASSFHEKKQYYIATLQNIDHFIVELCCLATVIDLEYFSATGDLLTDPVKMVHLFYDEFYKSNKIDFIITKNDPLLHYSADSLSAYLPKLKWRIINNVHYPARAEQGAQGRTQYSSIRYKKYIFPFYSVSIVLPILDSLYLFITRKNAAYLLHPFLCLYVTFYIFYQYTRKLLRLPPKQKTYDGKSTE